jgi:dCTP deaminase
MLTSNEIEKQIKKGNIVISPYNKDRLNINSYNLSLYSELMIYPKPMLDMKRDNDTCKVRIPKKGLLLKPNELYLARTNEYTETYKHIPCIDGRSSIARLGLFIHVTAGFGDIGFCGYWTLEIMCIKPIIIYANTCIAQISYHKPIGKIDKLYKGKYQDNKDIQSSWLWKEL